MALSLVMCEGRDVIVSFQFLQSHSSILDAIYAHQVAIQCIK